MYDGGGLESSDRNAIKQQSDAGFVEFHLALRIAESELAPLQTLGDDYEPGPIPEQTLQEISPPVDEDEKVPADGVLSQLALDERLQTQEAMTAQIADAIQGALNPRGVAVMIEAEHMCMVMRGIRKAGSTTATTTFTGVFKDVPEEQVRFMMMARGKTD